MSTGAATAHFEESSRRWQRPAVAWSITAFDCSLFIAFAVVYLTPLTPTAVYQAAGAVTTLLFVLPFSAYAIFGGLVASCRPANRVGWLVLAGATMVVLGACSDLLASILINHHANAGAWIGLVGVLWAPGLGPTTACLLVSVMLFPDGRLISHHWRWIAGVAIVFAAITVVFGPLDPTSFNVGIGFGGAGQPAYVNAPSPIAVSAASSVMPIVWTASTISEYVVGALAVLSVFLRLRGADSDRRHQIKWFGVGVTITMAANVAVNVLPSPAQPSALLLAIVGPLALLTGLTLPLCAAVAILKYRLYDIDVVISRALVYGTLAVLITGVYVGIAVGIGELVGSGGRPNLGLSIVATAIVAVGFQPARERLQRFANWLVYGRRATPYQVLSQFSSQVADSYAADEVLPYMARVLAEGTAAELATVWLRAGGRLHAEASYPDTTASTIAVALDGSLPELPGVTRAVEVRHQNELLGALSVVKRRGETLTPVEEKLLGDLAHQAGLVLKNVRLTADLQRRLEELRLSRQRLVTAQDEERRRLERNLHDGAQQHLVALKVKLGLAEMLADRDPQKAQAEIVQLKADVDEALETLRDLARGIYPPLLADKGLVAALESQARKVTVPAHVRGDGVTRYPQDVEATVYFCVLEALQNVQKYAAATHVSVRLRDSGGVLHFEVHDDGRGFDLDRVPRGAGLTNMRDRVDAVGGSLHIQSAPGEGTTLRGSISGAARPVLANAG